MKIAELIAKVHERTAFVHPQDIAREVLHEIDPEDALTYLSELLPDAVTTYLSRERSKVFYDRDQIQARKTQAALDTRRSWMTRFRNASIRVSETTWKPLGKCTYEDLMFAVNARRDQANLLWKSADRYEALANALQEYNVTTVEELPEDILLTPPTEGPDHAR